MGCSLEVKCLRCGHIYYENYGGGMIFHLVRCNKCGKTKTIDFYELGELHERYLKGLPGPYCVATREHDKFIQEHSHLSPISKEEYEAEVDMFAGECPCGGSYQLKARARCPICHSTRLKETRNKDSEPIEYD